MRAEAQRERAIAQGQRGREFVFVGVAHTTAARVRTWQVDECDVLYDPRLNRKADDFDLAHANVVFRSTTPQQLENRTADDPAEPERD